MGKILHLQLYSILSFEQLASCRESQSYPAIVQCVDVVQTTSGTEERGSGFKRDLVGSTPGMKTGLGCQHTKH